MNLRANLTVGLSFELLHSLFQDAIFRMDLIEFGFCGRRMSARLENLCKFVGEVRPCLPLGIELDSTAGQFNQWRHRLPDARQEGFEEQRTHV